MKNLTIIGRILFALPFGIIGLNHFLFTEIYLGMLTSFIPEGVFTIFLTGAVLIGASISIILNKYIKTACYILATLLLIFIVTIHIPGLFSHDIKTTQFALMQLLKDTGLMGGAIMIASFYDKFNIKN